MPLKSKSKNWIILIFIISTFVPTFNKSIGSIGIGIVYVITSLAIVVMCLSRGGKLKLHTGRESVSFYFLMISLSWYGIVMLASAIFISDNLIVRDAYDIYRPIAYLLFVIAPFFLVRTERDVQWIQIALVVCFLITCMLAVNQFLRWEDSISLLYTKELNVTTRRLSAPFANPYDMAYFMALILPMAITGLYVSKSFMWLIVAVGSLLILLFTQSRSVMGAVIVQIAIILPLLLSTTKRSLGLVADTTAYAKFKLLIFVIATVAGGVWFWISYSSELGYLLSGFESVLSGQEIGSMTVRKVQLQETINRAAASLPVALFGNGPAKAEMEHVESIYVYFLFRYGITGFIFIFIIPFIISIFNLVISVRCIKYQHEYILVIGLLAWLLALPVASIGNNFTEQVRLSFFYYFAIGFSVRLKTILNNRN